MSDAIGESCKSFFKKAVVDPFGFPIASYLDNGPQFVDRPFPEYLNINGVKRILAPGYAP